MIQQLSIFIENIPGSLMQVTNLFTGHDINMQAISSFDSPEFGILRVIVDQPQKAKEVLESKNIMVKLKRVIAVSVADQPGALNKLLAILAEGNVSVNYIYSFISEVDRSPIMIFHTNYIEEACQLLKRQGMHVVESLKDI